MTIKIIFIAIGLFLIGMIIFSLIRSSWLRYLLLYDAAEFLTYRPFGVRKIEKAWNKIVVRLDAGLESEYKLAVIEADSMFNELLGKMGYGGDNLGERLNKLTMATLPNMEEIKQNHQKRNNIVHDSNYKLSSEEAKEILGVYEQAFRDLQAF